MPRRVLKEEEEFTERPRRKGFPIRGKDTGKSPWVRPEVDTLSGLCQALPLVQ